MEENPLVRGWMSDARQGSRETLGQLLELYRPYLLQIANQELESGLQAKAGGSDLVQQTFLEAQRDFPRFAGSTEAELIAWLRRILTNNLMNFSAQYQQTSKRQLNREVPLDLRAGNLVMSTEPSPSGQALARERAELLDRSLERLPAEYRQVILYRNRDRLSFAEIGRAMDRSADAARKLWSRAVERLQDELDPHR